MHVNMYGAFLLKSEVKEVRRRETGEGQRDRANKA